MSERIPIEKSTEQKKTKIERLTGLSASLEERIQISRELFSVARKEQMRNSADRDKHGRPVSYFRVMDYKELGSLLSGGIITPMDKPQIREVFDSSQGAAKHNLEREVGDLPYEIRESLKPELEKLYNNFTLENYIVFVQTKLPRVALFALHFSASRFTGLIACSIGAPDSEPHFEPARVEKESRVVVEMVIPSDQIFLHLHSGPHTKVGWEGDDHFGKWEREVDLGAIKSEWVIDVYQDEEEFVERFIKNHEYPVFGFYQKSVRGGHWLKEEYATDILRNWSESGSLDDLLPENRLSDWNKQKEELLYKPLIESTALQKLQRHKKN